MDLRQLEENARNYRHENGEYSVRLELSRQSIDELKEQEEVKRSLLRKRGCLSADALTLNSFIASDEEIASLIKERTGCLDLVITYPVSGLEWLKQQVDTAAPIAWEERAASSYGSDEADDAVFLIYTALLGHREYDRQTLMLALSKIPSSFLSYGLAERLRSSDYR